MNRQPNYKERSSFTRLIIKFVATLFITWLSLFSFSSFMPWIYTTLSKQSVIQIRGILETGSALLFYYLLIAYIPFHLVLGNLLGIVNKQVFKARLSIGHPRSYPQALCYVIGLVVLIDLIYWLPFLMTNSLSIRTRVASNQIKILAHFYKGTPFIYYAARIMLLAPIIEELLFRGILLHCWEKALQPALPRREAQAFAILISAYLFSYTHAGYGDMAVVLKTFIMGLILGYSCCKKQTLFIPIAAHSLSNAIFLMFQVYCYGWPLTVS